MVSYNATKAESTVSSLPAPRDVQGLLIRIFNTETGRVERWVTPISGYGELNGQNLPVAGADVWRRPDGNFAYVEVTVTKVGRQ